MSTDIDLSKTTFLLVDDKAFYRDMAHTALARAHAKNIEHALDVEKAKQIITRLGRRIGCIICDWDMAPEGGLELLQSIRARQLPTLPPGTPFVILTGRADSDAIKAAMSLDVNGVAIAPLSFEKLIKTISNAVGRTWDLRAKEHYAAVKLTQSSKTAPPPTSKSKTPHPRAIVLKKPTEPPHTPCARDLNASKGNGKTYKPAAPELTRVHMSNLARVSPGDIIARDLKDKDGRMLVSTGTELTSSIIERLKDHSNGHPDAYHLWVGEWEIE